MMQAENIDIRTNKIHQFIIIYFVFILLCSFFFYWAFVKIPKAYQNEQALTSAKLNEFLENTAKVDTLVLQIQTKENVKEKSIIAFYEWMNTLKSNYPNPLYQSVLNSYLMRVSDIQSARQKDTSLLKLRQQFKLLKAETSELLIQNNTLKQQLTQRKSQ